MLVAVVKTEVCVQQYWVRDEPYRFIPVLEISEAFASSKWGQANTQRLEQPFERSQHSDSSLVTQKYALSGAPPSQL